MPESIYTTTLRGGSMFSMRLKRHRTLKISTQGIGANLALLMYNADRTYERYNMADTLKAQHTAYITKGHCLYSDMGRVLLSVTEDTCGWHDTIGGIDDAHLAISRWGEGRYQELRNHFIRNGKDNFLTEMGKWNLGKKDIVPNLNLFSKVWVDEESGAMNYVNDQATEKCSISLRAEMNVLLIMSATHHSFYEGSYQPAAMELELFESQAPGREDYCRNHSQENQRAMLNTENFFAFGI